MKTGRRAPAKNIKRGWIKSRNIAKAIEEARLRNNDTHAGTCTNLLIFAAVARLQNIRFENLEITEFNTASTRSSKNYALLIINLFLTGTAAKTALITSFGLCYTSAQKIVNNLERAGYIETFTTPVQKTCKGSNFTQLEKHLRLTSKGYDKAGHIADLLTDTRII